MVEGVPWDQEGADPLADVNGWLAAYAKANRTDPVVLTPDEYQRFLAEGKIHKGQMTVSTSEQGDPPKPVYSLSIRPSRRFRRRRNG